MSSHAVQTRWEDIDALGHVGHTAVLVLLEQGRDSFLGSHGIGPDQYVVGRCSVTFEREIDPSQKEVTVECSVQEMGTSSLTTTERILDPAGEIAVAAEFGLVLWDPQRRGSRPITDTERASLAGAEEVAA
ncbi:MAG: acyl-CoA thioesterase [Solirubrobacterales bacterium]